jgi:hypothetical protein
MTQIRCERCHANKPGHEFVRASLPDGSWRVLCGQCFNEEMAQFAGIQTFEHSNFGPLRLPDAYGDEHEFQFRSLLLGARLSLEAIEIVSDSDLAGYHFQVLGDPASDSFALLGQLVQKMKRAMAHAHLAADAHGLQIAGTKLKGRIECDDNDPTRQPCVIVDGRAIHWTEFGAMLLAFEGWQFRLEMLDPSDEP